MTSKKPKQDIIEESRLRKQHVMTAELVTIDPHTLLSNALAQIVKYALFIQANQNLAGPEPSFTEEQKDELVRRALMSTEGKVALMKAMTIKNK